MSNIDIVARLQLRAEQFSSETGARFAELKSRAASTAQDVRSSFASSLGDVQKIAEKALVMPRTSAGALDLSAEIRTLKDAATASDQRAVALRELSVAQTAAAGSAGVDAAALRLDADAAAVSSLAAEKNAGAIRERIVALEAVQGELNKNTSATLADGQAMEDAAKKTGNLSVVKAMLQHQIRAVSDSFAAGLPLSMIFGEHIAEISEIMAMYGASAEKGGAKTDEAGDSMIEGGVKAVESGKGVSEAAESFKGFGAKAEKVAEFMAGPWGIALSIGVATLGPMVVALLAGNHALDDAIEKLKKDADATEVTRQAKEQFARTEEGVAAAIRDQSDAFEKNIASQRSSAEQANINSRAELQREIAIRKTTLAMIEQSKAQADSFSSGVASGAGELLAQQAASARVADLQGKADEQNALIDKARKELEGSRVELAAENAKNNADPIKRINNLYDEQIRQLEILKKKEIDRGATVGAVTQAEFDAIERNRKAALKAEQDRENAERSAARAGPTTPFLTPVTGARVTGRFDEQRPGHIHAGVDLAVPVGTAVRAPAAGTVDVAGERAGYGNAIYINFGAGTTGRFGHLSKFNVKPGDKVDAGDIIGYTGGAKGAEGAGDSTGPHLHYEIRRNGKAVDPTKGAYPTDSGQAADDAQKIADKAARAQEDAAKKAEEAERQRQELLRRSGDEVANINARWDEQPKLIDRAAQDSRKLDEIVSDLSKQPVSAETEKLIEAARKAQSTIVSGLEKPFRDFVKAQRESVAVQSLALQGRDDEAAALQTALRLNDQGVHVDAARLAQLVGIERQQRLISEALEDQRRIVGYYGQAVGDVQQAVNGFLDDLENKPKAALGDLASGLLKSFNGLQNKLISEQLFGGMEREIERYVAERGGGTTPADMLKQQLGDAGTVLDNHVTATSSALDDLVKAFQFATTAIGSTTPAGQGPASADVIPLGGNDLGAPSQLDLNAISALAKQGIAEALGTGAKDAANDNGASTDIVVTGQRQVEASEKLRTTLVSTSAIFDRIGGSLLKGVENTIGVKLPASIEQKLEKGLGTVLQGASAGQLGGGIFSAITGGKQNKTAESIGGALGEIAGKTLAKPLASAIGGTLGKTLGGAAGPIGAVLGGVLGDVLGGLFSSPKFGTAPISVNQYGSAVGGAGTGNGGAATLAATGLASSVASGINSLADQLGAKIDNLAPVTVGNFDGKYRVAETNTSASLNYNNFDDSVLKNFGDDQQAAIQFAVQYALSTSVMSGISKASQNIIKSGSDLSVSIQKALMIESIPKDLKAALDPVGAAVDALNEKWNKTVEALKEGGATAEQMAQAQQLYNLQLDQAKSSTDAADATLKDFLKGLKLGSDSPYSLRDQETTAKSALQPFLDQINAGKTVDQSKYQSAAQSYLDVERQLYGSTQGYFDALDQIQAVTNKAIDKIDNAAPIASPATATDPFASATASSTAQTANAVRAGNEMAQDTNDLLAQAVSLLSQVVSNTGSTDSTSFIGAARAFVQKAA